MANILIAEDEKTLRDPLGNRLKKEGYTVFLAENGKIALDIVKNNHIDYIILDLKMPVMDGQTFLYKLQNEVKQSVPILVLTNLTEHPLPENISEVKIKSNTSLDEVVETIQKQIEKN